jgi:hypothetical protein
MHCHGGMRKQTNTSVEELDPQTTQREHRHEYKNNFAGEYFSILLMEVPTRAWNWIAHTGHIVAQGQHHWL